MQGVFHQGWDVRPQKVRQAQRNRQNQLNQRQNKSQRPEPSHPGKTQQGKEGQGAEIKNLQTAEQGSAENLFHDVVRFHVLHQRDQHRQHKAEFGCSIWNKPQKDNDLRAPAMLPSR